jgi:hypothetical protein
LQILGLGLDCKWVAKRGHGFGFCLKPYKVKFF